MKSEERKIIVAVTGASGALYPQLLLKQLSLLESPPADIAVIFSSNAEQIWEYELGLPFNVEALKGTDGGEGTGAGKSEGNGESSGTGAGKSKPVIKQYNNHNFYAPFASGSAQYDTLIIIPASMGMVGRIAHGVSDDLITRAADVILKERRTLILVPRETPYSLIHLTNMKLLTEAGAIIAPATPSFYSKPSSITELASTVTHRILDLAGFEVPTKRWGE